MMKLLLNAFLLFNILCQPVWSVDSGLGNFFKEYVNSIEKKTYYWPPIAYAVEKDYDEIFLLLLIDSLPLHYYHLPINYSRGEITTIFQTIIFKGKFDLLTKALPIYLSTESKTVDEVPFYNLLLWSVQNPSPNQKLICEYLLELGANPNLFTNSGSTAALAQAILNRNLEIAQLLIGYGANPNLGGNNCPLQKAVEYGYYEGARFLIEHGAQVELSMIELAASRSNNEILDLLVETYYTQS